MRKPILVFTLVLSISMMYAQSWVRQHPFQILETLNAIEFAENGHGWVVGTNSTVMHTEDWGVSWEIQDAAPFGISLLCVTIAPNTNGQSAFVGGNTLLYTKDGGETWERPLLSTNPIYKIQVISEMEIIAFGYNGEAFRSIDGGVNWESFDVPGAGRNIGHFIDSDNGWLISGNYNDVRIYKTVDGGDNWTELTTEPYRYLGHIEMINATTGFIDEGESIYKTTDGGQSWTIISDDLLNSANGLHVIDEQNIWACTNNGYIYHTEDGGDTWSFEYPEDNNSSSLQDIYATTSGLVWTSGKFTSVYYSSDSGSSWQDQIGGRKDRLQNIDFYDDDNGIACGLNGAILRTQNGGSTWEDISMDVEDAFMDIKMTSATSAFMISSYGSILKTTDMGDTWEDLNPDGSSRLESIELISDDRIIASYYTGEILLTTDGGENWNSFYIDGCDYAFDIHFVNELVGYVAAESGELYKTIDGGENWNLVQCDTDQDLYGVHFVTEEEGWVIGRYTDSTYHTRDGGQTWTAEALGLSLYWHDMAFINQDTGWIAGGTGQSYILKTVDGGQTWTWDHNDFAGSWGLCALPNGKVWSAGAGGSIIYYSSCNAIPSISDFEGPTTVCAGDTISYSIQSSEVSVFEWEFPDDWILRGNENSSEVEFIVGNSGGNVSVVGGNTCDNYTEALSENITVDVTPDVMISYDDNLLSTNADGDIYSWYQDGLLVFEGADASFQPSNNGLYQLVVTFSNGCTSSSNVFIVTTVSVDDVELAQRINVFPNPSNGHIYINYPSDLNVSQISIMNPASKVVWNEVDLDNGHLNLTHLPVGMYYLLIDTGEGRTVKKIIVQ